MQLKNIFTASLLVSLTLLLAACSNMGSSVELSKDSGAANQGVSAGELAMAGQIPPGGAKIDYEKSLIFGSGQNGMGRLNLELNQAGSAAYSFFLEQYPRQGWMLVSAVRGKTSLLVFTKPDRSITVELTEGNFLGGSTAVLTVIPRSALPEPPPQGGAGAAPGARRP